MRVISRFKTYGKKMVTVMVGKNVSVMTENDYKRCAKSPLLQVWDEQHK